VPFYGLTTALKPYWSTLAVVGLGLGAVLMAVCTYVPQLAMNKAAQIAPALILGVGLFGLSQRLTSLGIDEANVRLTWNKTEEAAFKAAAAAGTPILIDMWAEWCEACKKMDASTFQDPRVQERLAAGWVLLKMDLTESTPETDALQEKYELTGLPTLVMLPASASLAERNALTGFQSPGALLNELAAFAKRGD
jgi:thiol:disulfide interchange protein DsbD